jgi:hypothetical protein
MTRVRIVGGGLMGVAAAFEAHRLGCRDIELHERQEQLGGTDLPDCPQGLELRDDPIDFGPRGGALRNLLEWRGVHFDDAEVRPPAAQAPESPSLLGGSLADWIRAHPEAEAEELGRYCQWRTNAWLDEIDESALAPLGLLPDAAPPTASVRGGVGAMFGVCEFALRELGVNIHTLSMASPWEAMAGRASDEVVVWAADPTPLYRAADLAAPKALYISAPTYFFRAAASAPLQLRNASPVGVVAGISLYESRRQMVLAAECVAEASEDDIRKGVARLAAEAGIDDLVLLDELGVSLRPRRGYRSVDAAHQLRRLRANLAVDHGDQVVTGSWEPFSAADRFEGLRAGLARALAQETLAVAAA